MATIYRAHQISVNREVALKIIELEPDNASAFLRRFAHEAEMIAMLEHLHILPIYDYGVVDGEFAYYATRLMTHGTLADLLAKGPLPLEDIVELFNQIASGLDYMHDMGVIHRDLKPSNILLDDNGNAYLADFGLAHYSGTTIRLNDEERHISGSPAYVAPEQIRGEGSARGSDIYSLGVILYQMLAGRLPFESQGGVSGLLYKHLREKPSSPRRWNPNMSPSVAAVALRALNKKPEDRFLSAGEMAYMLRTAAQRPYKPRSRRSLLIMIVVCLLGLAGLARSDYRGDGVLPPPMNVQQGAHGYLADLNVTSTEIDLARERLDGGFIAVFPCTLNSTYHAIQARQLSDLAARAGLPLRVYDNQDDVYREVTLIEHARLEGAKAFIICPLEPRLFDTVATELRDASIPLVFSLLYDSPYGLKLELDNFDVGLKQGTFTGLILQDEHGGQGQVVLLTYLNIVSGDQRTEGMRAGLHAAAPYATILDPLQGYTRQQARDAVSGLIAASKHFDAVICMTDVCALGAIDALKEAHLTPKDVFIVSADNEAPIQDYIRQGLYVRGSVDVNRDEATRLLFNGTIKALAGSPVPEFLTFHAGAMITAANAGG